MENAGINSSQIEYWNDSAGRRWVKRQETLDLQIAPHGEAVIAAAALQAGEHVLDIGCGCGWTSLEAARRVGPTGRVMGLDISAPMLSHARERAKKEALSNIEFIRGDAQVYELPAESFDIVASRFGVMFFEDPAAAFANIRRGLKRQGRLAFACWQPVTANPWALLPAMAAAQILGPPPMPKPDEPGPFAFGDRSRLERILREAGFAAIDVQPMPLEMNVAGGGDLDETVEFMFEIGPLGRMVKDADEPTRDRVRTAVKGVLEKHHGPQGVTMPSAAWLVTARNA